MPVLAYTANGPSIEQAGPFYNLHYIGQPRCLHAGDQYMHLGGRDPSGGIEDSPCLLMERYAFRRVAWPVSTGTKTVTVQVKFFPDVAPRPILRVRADATLGVPSDGEDQAASGSDWQELSVTVTPTSAGVLVVELVNPSTRMDTWARWDDLVLG